MDVRTRNGMGLKAVRMDGFITVLPPQFYNSISIPRSFPHDGELCLMTPFEAFMPN